MLFECILSSSLSSNGVSIARMTVPSVLSDLYIHT